MTSERCGCPDRVFFHTTVLPLHFPPKLFSSSGPSVLVVVRGGEGEVMGYDEYTLKPFPPQCILRQPPQNHILTRTTTSIFMKILQERGGGECGLPLESSGGGGEIPHLVCSIIFDDFRKRGEIIYLGSPPSSTIERCRWYTIHHCGTKGTPTTWTC